MADEGEWVQVKSFDEIKGGPIRIRTLCGCGTIVTFATRLERDLYRENYEVREGEFWATTARHKDRPTGMVVTPRAACLVDRLVFRDGHLSETKTTVNSARTLASSAR